MTLLSRRRTQSATLGFTITLGWLLGVTCGPYADEDGNAHAARTAPALPGIGADDPRARLDPEKTPWRAIGKLQAVALNLRVTCTGTLVTPETVFTAARCVYNTRTGQYFSPGSIHFLIGYDRRRYIGHSVGIKLETAPGYDPSRPKETIGSDWALISLATTLSLPDQPLPITGEPPELESPVMLGGYQQDHPLTLMVDTQCRIIGSAADANGRPLLRHNCAATRGVSGAPLLIDKGGRWYAAGVDVAGAGEGASGGFAVVLDEARKHL
jgi:protease YdgD